MAEALLVKQKPKAKRSLSEEVLEPREPAAKKEEPKRETSEESGAKKEEPASKEETPKSGTSKSEEPADKKESPKSGTSKSESAGNEEGPKPGTSENEEGPKPGTSDENEEGPKPGTSDENEEGPKPGTSDENEEGPKPGTSDENVLKTEDPKKSLQKPVRRFKVLILGAVSVGKTTLVNRYAKGLFATQNYKATVGVDCVTKMIETEDCIVKLDLYDIGGQERNTIITRPLYRNSTGAIVMYDISQPPTFDVACRFAVEVANSVLLPNGLRVPCILLGNKCDMVTNIPDISSEVVIEQAQQCNIIKIFLVSALQNINVDEAFNFLIEQMKERVTEDYVRPDEELVPQHIPKCCK